MSRMQAAVVTAFGEPPHYGSIDVPVPAPSEELVDVLAVGVHPRTRSGAAGAHYTSSGTLPMVPGIDAVGRRADGRLVYFVTDDDVIGTMAERAAVDPRRAIELPDGVDVATVAAAMNPAMSSWVALGRRIRFEPGQSVLVLGATGNAGTMALQVARRLGAGRIVAAGRDRTRLAALTGLGADALVVLTDDPDETAVALADAAAEVDVVLDYLWGPPTERAVVALLTARHDRSRPLQWVEIGSVAGAAITLPSAALRSAALTLVGSGQGSVSGREYLASLPSLVAEIEAGTFSIAPRVVSLADVTEAWGYVDAPGERTVLVP